MFDIFRIHNSIYRQFIQNHVSELSQGLYVSLEYVEYCIIVDDFAQRSALP